MTEKKITKRARFTALLEMDEVKADPGMVEFIQHEIELLNRKNASGEKKLTPTQQANMDIKSMIAENMTPNRMYTVTEVIKAVPGCGDYSNQKLSSLLKQMSEAGVIKRIEDKRKTYYQLVTE